ncbi:MAG: MBL fold metallo-hydrolase [Verrucomicrobiae bacterium]|nr:MBL fold metallo-hydrolase [Verrucomicrobiae bacterium]MDW8342952.1 MBL fold metallo-hydrolase [Verrucomicrobiae bacterium]
MGTIPLEDSFADVVGKAQRGLGLSDAELAKRAGVSVEALAQVKSGKPLDDVLRKIAGPLGLNATALIELANQRWRPATVSLDGLAQFNTRYEDMTVNAYVVWNPNSRQGFAFDTGATAEPMLDFVRERGIKILAILLTHTHGDHIADLDRLRRDTGAPVFCPEREALPGTELFGEGKQWSEPGGLRVEARLTCGHSVGGMTFVVSGLGRPVAVVGDALFAASMGGGLVSFAEALDNNRRKIFTLPPQTILCPGHGPMTTVGEELQHNPFYAR